MIARTLQPLFLTSLQEQLLKLVFFVCSSHPLWLTHPPPYDDFKTFPSQPLSSSKSHKYNKAPYTVYSYSKSRPQAIPFARLFTSPQAELTLHISIDTPMNTLKLYFLQESDQ